ncbi:MAG: DeoR/GlpR family DNA-binding transcription regulator [Gordonia sp. (in: high G+C Gram-positive bacteria)]|uniref:DeoR/GlpR family DNA-binding transcription regulator n=1 Tax=Gordonia sp. (in: high G+C Gram-positive bacteria) TaxID=84139 RepID=UPI0039E6C025
MYAEERQQAIADEVRARGRVSVADLAVRFDVTGETVRRDLGLLARAGVLQRVHGGAVRPDVGSVAVEADLTERELTWHDEKVAIGAAAQRLLPPSGGSVLFDAGTTTYQAAAAVTGDRELNVVTNAVPIAAELSRLPSCEVVLTGGRIRGKTQAAVGPDTVAALARLRVSVAFIGTNGFSLQHGLSTPDPDEAAAKRAMIGAANHVVVLADSTKINREDLVSFGTLPDIGTLVTDAGIDPAFAAQLRAHDIEVVIA